MANDPAVSIIVHTRNSARTLPRTLATVGWADEIVVVDMASDDETCTLATAAGARVLHVDPYPRVDGVRTRFLSEAAHDWTFVIDADEYLAADAPKAVADLIATHGRDFDAFAIPRFNYFGGRRLEGGGWYPDHQIRLFRRGSVAWQDGLHKAPDVLTGRLKFVEPPGCLHIHHSAYADLAHFVCKQAEYARDDIYSADGQSFSFEAVVAHAYEEYQRRQRPGVDDDYARAVTTILAWDQIIRGLIHWDRLGRKHPLPDIYSLPVVITKDDHVLIEALKAEQAALQGQVNALLASSSWRMTRPLRTIINAARKIMRRTTG